MYIVHTYVCIDNNQNNYHIAQNFGGSLCYMVRSFKNAYVDRHMLQIVTERSDVYLRMYVSVSMQYTNISQYV